MAPEPVDREPKARLPFLSRMLTLPWVAGAGARAWSRTART